LTKLAGNLSYSHSKIKQAFPYQNLILKTNGMGLKRTEGYGKKLITETGVGWSTELGTISATDEWWQSKIQVSLLICNSLIIFFVMLYYLFIYYHS
jgi:hypothetical protein